ncbi:MAG: flavodoxin, partial [Firmicutes bacterium]|nr:flavodoxin [Bacillota bacterium]
PIRSFIAENKDALRNLKIASFACESGAGAEKAFGKLKEALGRSSLEAELILIDPKDKPSGENLQKIEEFCSALGE